MPLIHASASSAIAPFAIQATTISAQFSYPSNFHFNSGASSYSDKPVSLTISATFNNASVSAVNVTSIYVRLYPAGTNITSAAYQTFNIAEPEIDNAYALADWLSGYNFGSPYASPHEIRAESLGQTASLDTVPMSLEWIYGSYLKQEVQATLFVEIRFRLIGTNGNAIVFTTHDMTIAGTSSGAQALPNGVTNPSLTGMSSRLVFTYYTGEGETPCVTINPPAESPQTRGLLSSSALASVIALALISGSGIGLVIIRGKRKHEAKLHPTNAARHVINQFSRK